MFSINNEEKKKLAYFSVYMKNEPQHDSSYLGRVLSIVILIKNNSYKKAMYVNVKKSHTTEPHKVITKKRKEAPA